MADATPIIRPTAEAVAATCKQRTLIPPMASMVAAGVTVAVTFPAGLYPVTVGASAAGISASAAVLWRLRGGETR